MRVAIIDRHPAMRAGMQAILERCAGVEVVASVGGDLHEIAHALYRTAPDAVMVEDAPGRFDGIELAREIKGFGPGAKILLHADRPDAVQIASAMLADADGIVDSAAQPREIIDALRALASGRTAFPALGGRERRELARRLPAEDHAILAMRLAATPRREIAETLRIDARALRRRVAAMIERLRTAALSSAPGRGAAPTAA
jgi:DNA-binding NarL/FixJ family response regulator